MLIDFVTFDKVPNDMKLKDGLLLISRLSMTEDDRAKYPSCVLEM